MDTFALDHRHALPDRQTALNRRSGSGATGEHRMHAAGGMAKIGKAYLQR